MDQPPEITVLITAHNEAEYIQSCLRSILSQDYPMERVEILLVDDRSNDETAARARTLDSEALRVLRIDNPPEKLTARQAALDLGFREARGEVVLVTDAGGRVPREWIREMTGHLGYRDGAATGPVVFAGGQPFLARFQTLEMLTTFTLLRWISRHGKAAGVIGANMAIRREAYLETGGFPTIGFALAEDLALGEALMRSGWSVRYLTGPSTLKPACETVREQIGRARRRAQKLAPTMKSLSLLLMFSNLLAGLLALIGLTHVWPHWGKFWVTLFLLRYALGMFAIGLNLTQYGAYDLLKWVWLFEPLITLQNLWVTLGNWIAPRWEWGGLTYDRPRAQPEPESEPDSNSETNDRARNS